MKGARNCSQRGKEEKGKKKNDKSSEGKKKEGRKFFWLGNSMGAGGDPTCGGSGG